MIKQLFSLHRWAALVAAAAFGGVAASSSHAGDLVILESDVLGLSPGDIISDESIMDIPDGKSLVMMTETGQMISLAGPFSGVAEQSGEGEGKLVKAISNLILTDGSDTSSLGAVRDIGDAGVKDPWLLNVTEAGDFCYSPGAKVKMWRPKPDQFSHIRISNGEKAAKTKWPEQDATFGWPPPIPLVDGQLYQFTLDDETNVKVRAHEIPETLSAPGEKAVWMAEKGCRRQAVLFLVASVE